MGLARGGVRGPVFFFAACYDAIRYATVCCGTYSTLRHATNML